MGGRGCEVRRAEPAYAEHQRRWPSLDAVHAFLTDGDPALFGDKTLHALRFPPFIGDAIIRASP